MSRRRRTPPRQRPAAIWAGIGLALLGALWAGLGLGDLRNPDAGQVADRIGQAAGQISGTQTDAPAPADAAGHRGWPAWLPPQGRTTVARIQRGDAHPYRQDGTTFHNRERRLPQRERGWYREYTVDTPGLSHRGARRIVTGGHPPTEWHYTDDHYDSFRSFTPPAPGSH